MMTRTEAPTQENRSFHTIKTEYLTTMIDKSPLSESDKHLIEEFMNEKKGLVNKITHKKGISPARIKKIYFHLIRWRECSGMDFPAMTFKDVIRTMNTVEDTGKFNQSTIRDHIAIVKMFFAWLHENDKTRLSEKELKKITIPSDSVPVMEKSKLLTEEDKDQMIKGSMSPMHKAIISLLWEGGLRPVEIGRLKASDIEFNDISMYINVIPNRKTMNKDGKGKSEKPRRIPCPVSMPYMKAWFDAAPYEMNGDSLVFCSLTPKVTGDGMRHYLPLKDDSLRQQLRIIAERAGVTRYQHPYQFRHSTITRWVNAGIPERQVMEISHGGNTRMLARYFTPEDDKIEDSINEKIHKIPSRKAREEKRQQEITERICQKCGAVHDKNFRFCSRCGSPLTREAQATQAQAVSFIDTGMIKNAQDPAFIDAVARRMLELQK